MWFRWLTFLGLALPAYAGVVDRVVVIVDDELVLASDMELEAVLSGLDRSPSPFWTRAHGTPQERLTEAAIVRILAAGVSLFDPPADEVAARVTRLRERLGDNQSWNIFLALWGLDDAAVARLIRRRMVVERYLARNIAEDPNDVEKWLSACHELLAEVRQRLTVREVAQRGPS
jgi:hypothetical protein